MQVQEHILSAHPR